MRPSALNFFTCFYLILTCVTFAVQRAEAANTNSFASESQIEVDEIEVSGVTIFSTQEVQAALVVTPGEKLDRTKVTKTDENLKSMYNAHGYGAAMISTRLVRKKVPDGAFENVLEVAVREGKPTRIAGIHFVPETAIKDEKVRAYWDKVAPLLNAKFGLNIGDILDQERIAAGKRVVQDLLASEEFVGAKAEDVRYIPSDGVAGFSEAKNPVDHWVTLEIHVDLGDRVSFGFRGNTVLNLSELSGIVDDQRHLGLGKDYVGAIRSQIVDKYKLAGYANVKVDALTVEDPVELEKHVTYVIDEGPRVSIDSISFDGNQVFSIDQLRSQFYAKASVLVQHGYYYEKDVQKAAELVIDWLKSRGYLGAKLVTVKSEFPRVPTTKAPGSEVKLTIYIYEGDQTIVQSTTFDGAKALSPDAIREILNVQVGGPLNLFAFSEGIDALKSVYRAKGYLDVRILNEGTDSVIRYSEENRSADISLEVSEGPQYRVSRSIVEGLEKTKEDIVRREFKFVDGQVLSESQILETEAVLRRLGIFSTVAIHATNDPTREGYKIVRVVVQEGSPGSVGGGLGFRNDLGIRAFGQTDYTNLWGKNHTVSLNLNANRRLVDYEFIEYQAQLSYIWPWFAIPELTFRPAVSLSRIHYILLDADSSSASLTWDRKLFRDYNITGSFLYSLESITQYNSGTAIDNQQYLIGGVTPSITWDARDDRYSPTTGWFLSASFEYAAPWLLSQSDPALSYYRFITRVDRFIPVSRDISLYLSVRTGFEKSLALPQTVNGVVNQSTGAIPVIKQFALGGIGSLRGWNEQELAVASQVTIQGTLAYVNYRAQLDLPFTGSLRFGPFLDMANLLIDEFSFTDQMNVGTGFGFHYQTPVGPLSLDWGFKLGPVPDNHIYFSVGII